MDFNEIWSKTKIFCMKIGEKTWEYLKVAKIELLVFLGLLVLDLVVKTAIAGVLNEGEVIEIIPSFLNITYVKNYMAAFGSFFGLEKFLPEIVIRIFLIIFTLVAIVVFSIFLYRSRKKSIVLRLSLALIISGALGNFFDRIFLGYVRDFVQIVYFGLDIPVLGTSFAIFNIADACLTVGVVMFAVFFIFIYKEPKTEKKVVYQGEQINSEEENANNMENAAAISEESKAETTAILEESKAETAAILEENKAENNENIESSINNEKDEQK